MNSHFKKQESPIHIYCPKCKKLLPFSEKLFQCTDCDLILTTSSGVYNLKSEYIRKGEEEFYDKRYTNIKQNTGMISIQSLSKKWNNPVNPHDKVVRKEVGNVKGKRILLLGNGSSDKELLFLIDEPELLVFSDLSLNASENIIKNYDLTLYKGKIRFAAINAENIPFEDDSFDLVYAYGMVHHLPHLSNFFKSANRVLKPGGKAIFCDSAYSPIWFFAKKTFLKHLMLYSHKKSGISPEDLRFTLSGGFKENELAEQIYLIGGIPWFHRTSFFNYFIARGMIKFLSNKKNKLKIRLRKLFSVVNEIDGFLGKRFIIFKKNQIVLVWGFNKPI